MNRETSELEIQSALSERYTDFSKVGEGGMAVVYRAHDRVLLRDVAIKTLRIKNMTPDMVTRFQREARTAGKLQHPNVVTVLDFGMSEQIPYLIMDYAAGETLASIVEVQKKLRFGEAVELASEVCRGMAFAHANGVVHRDLKPSNIVILSQPEADARVKIVDFGIAKIVQSLTSDTEFGAITAAHYIDGRISNSQLIGSPFYMSPEQIRGEVIDARSDIYSFGCTLYQMLTGRVPFNGETKLETFKMHLNDSPSPISEPGMPQDLCDLVMQCLEKNPDKRPASMAEIAGMLSKSLDDSESSNESDDGDPSKSNLQQKKIVVVAAAFVLLILGGIVFTKSQDKPPKPLSKAALKAKFVRKITERYWKREQHHGREYWIASSNLTDPELITIVVNKPPFVVLKQADITNAGLASLAGLPIRDLDLTMTKLDDSAAPYLSNLKMLDQLTLTSTKFTDAGLARLVLPNLLHLDLDDLKQVTDRGLETVVNRWPNLTYLNISNTSVTSKGLLKLAKLPRLTGLEVADLTLSDDAMKQITSLPLTMLSLNSSNFSKKWLANIAQMKTLKNLYVSDLKGCTDKDYEDLRARMPRVKILCVNMANQRMDDVADFTQLMQ